GGNITGFASHESSLGGKWLEVLKETTPQITRVLAIVELENAASQAQWRSVEEAAQRLAIEAMAGNVHHAPAIEPGLTSLAKKPNSGLVVLPTALSVLNASAIIALAHRYRMPAVYWLAEAVAAGGLVSYGLNWDDHFRRAAGYVDRILNGTKPADLPVQQP